MNKPSFSQSLSPSLLIVDDNPHNLQVLGKLLKDNNYEIEFAVSGEAALEWLKTRSFDLILLDINMPGMNGFEVCIEIRLIPELNNVPVIFLSAEVDRESILKGFELGAQDYITKPFDSRELLSRVKTHLSLKESLEKLEKLNKSLEEKVIERTHQLKEANAKLETLNLKLLDLDKAKGDFLTIISHEIRTPLNGIIGPLELLKEHSDTRDIAELVEILDLSVNRLERFSLDALLITRLKTKQFEIVKEKIFLPDIINEVLCKKKKELGAKNLQLRLNIESTPLLISGESELVKKCIDNILDNAIFYSRTDGTVEISEYIENDNVCCVVKDDGNGFPDGGSNRVFELFAMADENKNYSNGIGLPISKMIMEAHGGNIIIGNNPDRGAFVKFNFQQYELS